MTRAAGVRVLDTALATAIAPAAACAAYLGLLSAASLLGRRAATSSPVEAGGEPRRFTFVVPAHDEADGIADTIASLAAVEHPTEHRRILVVADNCTDDTAARAAAAGADVLVRHELGRRGKGYALAAGFDAALADPDVDAVVVVDADTLVDPAILRVASAAMRRGELVMQADYRVRDPSRAWRTTLMEIAFSAMHTVRNEGRARLGLSVGLRGNGMVFTREALARCPHSSFGLVEDIEYATRLLERGIRVALLDGVTVRAAMPGTAGGATSQRVRWEEGRRRLRRSTVPGLVRDAVRRRSAVLADGAFELAAPPLSQLAAPLAGTAVTASLLRRHLGGRAAATAGVGLACLAGHVTVAWIRSGTGTAGLAALLRVPGYAAWKAGLRGRSRDLDTWVRTTRTEESAAA